MTSLFVAQGEALKAWAGGAPLQTDDRSALEFSGPRSIFGASRDDNAAALRELAAGEPEAGGGRQAALASATADRLARPRLDAAAGRRLPAGLRRFRARRSRSDPNDTAALDGLLRAAVSAEQIIEANGS